MGTGHRHLGGGSGKEWTQCIAAGGRQSVGTGAEKGHRASLPGQAAARPVIMVDWQPVSSTRGLPAIPGGPACFQHQGPACYLTWNEMSMDPRKVLKLG